MARPRKELEDIHFDGWEQLDALIVWATEEFCADKLGISVDSLAKRIKEKYDLSYTEYKKKRQEPLRINLLKKQYDVAMTGNVTMLIWLGKQYLGQSEKQEVQTNVVTGPAFKIVPFGEEEKADIKNAADKALPKTD